MPGPAPKRYASRQNSKNWLQLPVEGREGDPPDWPLTLGRPRKTELEIWEQVWSTPQAVMWEHLGWVRTVGRYVRICYEAERKDATAATRSECRQLEDRLGLTPMAMKRLQWEVVSDEVNERRQAAEDGDDQDDGEKKRRLMAVDPDAAAG